MLEAHSFYSLKGQFVNNIYVRFEDTNHRPKINRLLLLWSAHTFVYFFSITYLGRELTHFTCLMGGLSIANDVYGGFVNSNHRPKINILPMLRCFG